MHIGHSIFSFLCITIYSSNVNGSPQNRFEQQTRCQRDKFGCNNGQCIEAFSVCDGVEDCNDGSDETQAVCSTISVQCPTFAFRCAYGACVDGDSKCDGIQHCADNSDELLPECKRASSSSSDSSCKVGQFQCLSGECIDEFSVCDGSSDCQDESDESITQCVNIRCPSFSFQCAYGACIDKPKRCNGVEDCRDGSDEDTELCKKPKPSKPTRPTRPTGAPTGNQCTLPNKPDGGNYIVNNCERNDRSPKCKAVPGTVVGANTILTFNCSEGYIIEDVNKKNVFCLRGSWDPSPPICMRPCKPLISNSLDIDCLYQGEPVECDKPLKPRTKVKPKCKPSYHISDAASAFKETVCQSDGELETPLFRCVPDCGKANYNVEQALISYGETSKVGEYPWHVGLYLFKEQGGYEQACGGTIVTPHIILTAAHCVYLDDKTRVRDASELKVAAGKFKRSWDAQDRYVQKRDVREIIIQRNYRGKSTSYEQDIALLDLVSGFILSNIILPACIDWIVEVYFPPGTLGTVVGWGLTENKEPSEDLQVVKLPYLDYESCRNESPEGFLRFITYDKFCAGYRNGTGVQQGDSGGGLTFVRNNLHYVHGIVSVKPRDQDTFAAFTNVSEHLDWLQASITALKRWHQQ